MPVLVFFNINYTLETARQFKRYCVNPLEIPKPAYRMNTEMVIVAFKEPPNNAG